jgi:hypothetical protein
MGRNGDAVNLKGATVREGVGSARACQQGLSVAPEGVFWVGSGMHTSPEHPALCDHTLSRGLDASFQ